MRQIVLAVALLSATAMAGGVAFADNGASAPTSKPAPTAGWFNAEWQGDATDTTKRPTARVEQAMRQGTTPVVVAASARSPEWRA